jgi:hypothetical protein
MGIEVHPVQMPGGCCGHEPAMAPKSVTMRAYEVYCQLHGSQEAIVTGWCRGGFAIGELVAFLYARSFPREEWRQRVDEALRGMKNL